MMNLKEIYEIAKKENEGGKVVECIDLGNKYAFLFVPNWLENEEVLGINDPDYTTVDKENGTIGSLIIPPIENLELLNKGTPIDVKQLRMLDEQSQAGKLFNLDLGD